MGRGCARDTFTCLGFVRAADRVILSLSYEQVPQHEQRAEGRGAVENHLRCAPSLRRPLELLVPAPDILRCIERVLHQLLDMRRLYLEIASQRRLQL